MMGDVMKSFMTKMVLVLGISSLLAVGTPVAANATGNYYWQCLQLNGVQTPMSPGENLANCQGARLKKYLDGNLVKTYVLTGQHVESHALPPGALCYLAIAGTAIGVITATGWLTWVAVAVGVPGMLDACKA